MGIGNQFPGQYESSIGGKSKPRRYSTASTPQDDIHTLPMHLLSARGQCHVISSIKDVSSAPPTVSIANMNVMNAQQNSLVISPGVAVKPSSKSGRSISVSDPLSTAELTTKSSSSQSGRNGISGYHSSHAATKFKTEMCRPFTENGHCKYGSKCQFAHGDDEIRRVPRHPKFKTEMCRTFHTNGFCPYGPRCHFIHNEDDNKLEEISHQKQQVAAQQAAQQMAVEMAKIQLQRSALDAQLTTIINSLAAANILALQQRTDGSSMPPTPSYDSLPMWTSAPTVHGQQLGSSGEFSPTGSGSTSPPVLSPTFSNEADLADFVSSSSDVTSGLSPVGDESTSNYFVFPTPELSPVHLSPVKNGNPTKFTDPGDMAALASILQGLNFSGNPPAVGVTPNISMYS